MDDVSRRLRALGEAAAKVSDRASEGEGRAAIHRARRALFAPEPARRAPAIGRKVAVLAAACGAMLAAAVWIARAPHPLTYTVTASDTRPGVIGEWVAAGPEAPLTLRFSDTSVLALTPGARSRVTTTNARGADVLIERGTVHVAVAHAHRSARWALRAGPFDVRVTGTVFDASWDPVTETFDLVMHEGSVKVTGPQIPPDRVVVAGERLRVSVRDGRMDLSTGPHAASSVPAPRIASAEPSRDTLPEVAREAAPPANTATARVPAVVSPAWRDLAVAGRHGEALAAAEAAGFDREMARASVSDLLLLADAARLGGSAARAKAALLAARARGARGHTAFLLGKIAADQGGSAPDALLWLETYLVEQRGGAFAEQALGRIVELSRHDREAASRAASRYLAKHPNGAHAALARSILAAPQERAP